MISRTGVGWMRGPAGAAHYRGGRAAAWGHAVAGSGGGAALKAGSRLTLMISRMGVDWMLERRRHWFRAAKQGATLGAW